ncbi:MAG: hypothetical protein ACLFWD_04900 [Anaerolineales bacterium]
MSRLSRTDWLALVAGVLIGIALGLFYAWMINPVEYVQTTPSSLRDSYRQDYMALIASAYQATGNLERAEARLSLFELEDPSAQLAEIAQEQMAQDDMEDSAQALARLASDLGMQSTPLVMTQPGRAASSSPEATSPASETSTTTPTPRPSRTPTVIPTAGPPFELASREAVCDPALPGPLLMVEVMDAEGEPVAGVEIRVFWDQGEDRFYTGLKPEISPGYADFEMDLDLAYTVQLPEATDAITNVQAETCTAEDDDPYPGSVRLVFEQPGN